MPSPRQHRIGFTVLFLAAAGAFATGFFLTDPRFLGAGLAGSLSALLWGVTVTARRAAPAEDAPSEPAPAAEPRAEPVMAFEVVEKDAPAAAPEDEVDFHVVTPAPAPASPLPWHRPAPARAPAVAPGATGAFTLTTARPEWARPTSAVGGPRSERETRAPKFNHLGGGVTRGACGKCRTPLTLSARRPIRATCPVCGHSRVLQ